MNKELLPNGFIQLTAPNGVMDTRTGQIHSIVVCKPKNVGFFKAVE